MNNRMKKIQRIILVVHDIDKAMKFYTTLLGGTFYETDSKAYGVRCAINFGAGMELLSPLPGCDSESKRWLDTRGECLMGVVYEPEDIEQARSNAEKELGLKPLTTMDSSEEQLVHLFPGKVPPFKKYMQSFYNPSELNNVKLLFGEYHE